MDPFHEQQRLINEVIYLHSLWYQGPPRPPPPHLHHPYPQPQPAQPQPAQPPLSYDSSYPRLLQYCSNHVQFEKERTKRKRSEWDDEQQLSPGSGKEWPCEPSSDEPPPTTSDWNRAWPKRNSKPLLVSPEEKAKLAANQAQFKALKVTKDYFFTSDDENDSDDDDFMEGEEEEDGDGCEDYGFFVKLFADDKELREYYSKNYQNGEFFCLVCGGLGKKLAVKKYKGCIALVQHSISISRTKKKRAHRAYGRAICKILRWDIDNLAGIVATMAENHDLPSNSADQGDAENDGDASANVGGENRDGLPALEGKHGSIDLTNSVEGQTQAIIDEGAKNASTALGYNEGSMDVTTSAEGETGCDWKGKAEANVGEGTEDSSTILENKDAPVDACNCGILLVEESLSDGNLQKSRETIFCENSQTASAASQTVDDCNLIVPVVMEGKEAEKLDHLVTIIDGGDKDGSTALECKESSVDVTTLCPGDTGCDSEGKPKANIGEGTDCGSTILEKKDTQVDACSYGLLPAKESFSNGNLGSYIESTFSENSETAASVPKTAADYNLTVPVVREGKETEMLHHHEEMQQKILILA